MALTHDGGPSSGRGELLAAWVVLMVAAVLWGVANEQSDLQARAESALAGANLPGLVQVSGRDIAVVGGDPALSSGVVSRLESLQGVRAVTMVPSAPVRALSPKLAPASTSTSRVPATSSAAPGPSTTASGNVAWLTADMREGRLVIQGALPDPESAARIAAVADLVYAPLVVSELAVDPALPTPPWLDTVADAIAVLPVVGQARLELRGDRGAALAVAPSDQRAAAFSAAVSQALGDGIALRSDVTVTGFAAPVFEARTDGRGGVVLSGVVHDRSIVADVVSALEAVYGEGRVEDESEVRAGVDATFSLYRLPVALPLFAPFTEWEVAIVDDIITGSLRGGASFASGSARLTPELESLLGIAAGILTRNPRLAMTVAGHTDSVGSEAHNLQLSTSRAEAARNYLLARGIDTDRVTAIGYGETRPLVSNDTAEGRAMNRRVEFDLGPVEGDGD